MTNVFGRNSSTYLRYAGHTSDARSSNIDRRFPWVVKGWQGGPPARSASSPTSKPKSRRSAFGSTRSILSSITRVVAPDRVALRRNVSAASWSISSAARERHPADSRPASSPPAPEKSERNRRSSLADDSRTPTSCSCRFCAGSTDRVSSNVTARGYKLPRTFPEHEQRSSSVSPPVPTIFTGSHDDSRGGRGPQHCFRAPLSLRYLWIESPAPLSSSLQTSSSQSELRGTAH